MPRSARSDSVSGLDQLPDEILDIVVSFLQGDEGEHADLPVKSQRDESDAFFREPFWNMDLTNLAVVSR